VELEARLEEVAIAGKKRELVAKGQILDRQNPVENDPAELLSFVPASASSRFEPAR
jgi:hypothetical protein